MSMKRRWMVGILFAVATGLAQAQSLTDGPPPPPEDQKPGFDPSWLPQPIKAGRCAGSTCLLTIRVNGNCDITIDQHVDQQALCLTLHSRRQWIVRHGLVSGAHLADEPVDRANIHALLA